MFNTDQRNERETSDLKPADATLRATSSPFDWQGNVLVFLRNPLRWLQAKRKLRQYKSLDAAILRDAGLTRDDVDRATVAFFLEGPRR